MPTPAHWSNNNLACVNTWAFLRVLKQLDAVFGPAGDLTMKQLQYWNPADSSDARRTAAMGLAAQLDQMFVLGVRADYEPGYTGTKAIANMTETLVTEDKTVSELAVTVDDAYRFSGEKM